MRGGDAMSWSSQRRNKARAECGSGLWFLRVYRDRGGVTPCGVGPRQTLLFAAATAILVALARSSAATLPWYVGGLVHLLPLESSAPTIIVEEEATLLAPPPPAAAAATMPPRSWRLRTRVLTTAEWHARIVADAVREYAETSGRGEADVADELEATLARAAGVHARRDKGCGRALECLWLLGQAG